MRLCVSGQLAVSPLKRYTIINERKLLSPGARRRRRAKLSGPKQFAAGQAEGGCPYYTVNRARKYLPPARLDIRHAYARRLHRLRYRGVGRKIKFESAPFETGKRGERT